MKIINGRRFKRRPRLIAKKYIDIIDVVLYSAITFIIRMLYRSPLRPRYPGAFSRAATISSLPTACQLTAQQRHRLNRRGGQARRADWNDEEE